MGNTKSYIYTPENGTTYIKVPKILCKNCNKMKSINSFFKSPYYKDRHNRIHNCKSCYKKLRKSQALSLEIICGICGEIFLGSNRNKYCSKSCSKDANAYKQKQRRIKFLENNPEKAKHYAAKSKNRFKAVSRVTIKTSISSGKRFKHYSKGEVALIKKLNKNRTYKYTTMELSSMLGRSVDAIRKKRRSLRGINDNFINSIR